MKKNKGIFVFGIIPAILDALGNSSSNPGSNPDPEPWFKDRVWEELELKKREEWTRKGYSEHLQRMAIELAHDYARSMARWMSSITGVPKEELERKLYEYALEHVAEPWIEKMAQ